MILSFENVNLKGQMKQRTLYFEIRLACPTLQAS